MKKLTIALIISFSLFSIAYTQHTLSLAENQHSPKVSIEEVAWIAGHWSGEAFGGITEEIWSAPMGNSMMGAFRLVNEDKANFYEIMTITEENESLIMRLKHFHADLKGWEEKDVTVDFPLVKIDSNIAYFDGLTFEKVSEKKMNVYVVSEDKGGAQSEMKFSYELVK